MNLKKRLQVRLAVFFVFFAAALLYHRLTSIVPPPVVAPVANSESATAGPASAGAGSTAAAGSPVTSPSGPAPSGPVAFPTLAPAVLPPPSVEPTALPGMPTPTPYLYQHDLDHEHAIIAQGQSAIPDMLTMIEKQTPWSPETVELIPALTTIGDPAHQALLKAIPQEQDMWHRIHLIGALQESFHDFRYIGLWVPYLTKCPGTSPWLGRELYTDYHWQLPIVLAMNRGPVISPRFVIWYKKKFPGKPLPG